MQKAKEGIEDTIEEKELNVEMLMLFAAIGAAIIGYWAEGAIFNLHLCAQRCYGILYIK